MLSIIFLVALVCVTWKFLMLGIKLTWGFAKIVCTVFLFPVFMIFLAMAGLIYLALPILLIVGIVLLVAGRS